MFSSIAVFVLKFSKLSIIFKLRMGNRPTQEKYKLNLEILKSNQVRYGTKILRYRGPEV